MFHPNVWAALALIGAAVSVAGAWILARHFEPTPAVAYLDLSILFTTLLVVGSWSGARWFALLAGGVPLGVVIVARHGLRVTGVAAYLSCTVGIGQLLGRIGCWFAGCCYGPPSPEWGLVPLVPPPGGDPATPVIPLPLVEGAIDALVSGACLVRLVRTRSTAPGSVVAQWAMLHGFTRFMVDGFRADLGRLDGVPLTVTQVCGAVVGVAGAAVLFRLRDPAR